MRRGELTTALILGLAGAAVLAAAAWVGQVDGPGALLGAVLIANALVRLQTARL